MGKTSKPCKYEKNCMFKPVLGDEVCRHCTIGPRERAIDRRIRMCMWASVALNFAAMVMNLIRAFTR